MRSLTFVALAVSAAGVTPAMAQTVPDPSPYYGVPPSAHGSAGMAAQAMPPAPPAAGTTWHGPPMQMQMHGPDMHADMHGQSGPPMMMQMHHMNGPGMHGHVQFQHVQRGGTVPPFWRGSRVQVRNWNRYGFPAPFAGGQWIRYYDDALLIDGSGRVFDSRPDWDWDRYGDAWGSDDNGVPVYGDDDGPRGREWADHDDRDGGMREEREEHEEHGMRQWSRDDRDGGVRTRVYVDHRGPPPPPPGYGGYRGYGYGYGPVVVTETTVTEAPVVEARTYVSYQTVRVRVAHRHHHRCAPCACSCRVAPPAPVLGERG